MKYNPLNKTDKKQRIEELAGQLAFIFAEHIEEKYKKKKKITKKKSHDS